MKAVTELRSQRTTLYSVPFRDMCEGVYQYVHVQGCVFVCVKCHRVLYAGDPI